MCKENVRSMQNGPFQKKNLNILQVVLFLLLCLAPGHSCASHFDYSPFIDEAFKAVKPEHRRLKPQKRVADETLYSIRDFWTWDLSVQPPKCVKIPFVLVAVHPKNCLFVEKEAWEKNVHQNDIDAVNRYLNEKTPEGSINSGLGIYANNTDTFGDPPDIDGNKKTSFLYFRMGKYMGYGFDGYFNAFDQLPEDIASSQYKQHSNESDILYMNCAEKNISDEYMLSVLAHEFQHLIHYRYDQDELPWLNESLSEAAMTINGFFSDKEHVKKYTQMPEFPLVTPGRISYGACLLFGTYIYERFGKDFLKELVQSTDKSIESFSSTFKKLNITMDFRTLMKMWAAQNLLHPLVVSSGISSDFSYRLIDFQKFKMNHHFDEQTLIYSGVLKPFAIHYYSVDPKLAPFKVTVSEKAVNGASDIRTAEAEDPERALFPKNAAIDRGENGETGHPEILDLKRHEWGESDIGNRLADYDREVVSEFRTSRKIAQGKSGEPLSVQFVGISKQENIVHVADLTYSTPDQGKWDEIYLIVINFHDEPVSFSVSLHD